MLDITKEDIKNLNDTDLRILIGRLCEAELYEKDKNTKSVSYGGKQDEKDGGIDVRVILNDVNSELNGFVLRGQTIFQVKKPAMQPNRIKKEMKNKDGMLRECIKELSKNNGAYIIVSSGDDLTEITYKNRIKAMEDVLKEFQVNDLIVEYYDCNKIATWVRKYPALICWVNEKNKKNTNGWTSYCNWSNRSSSEQEFIISDESVIFYNDFNKESKLKLIDGINQIRENLCVPRKSVRLAGLSGVGKTRLAQALFDNTIGKKALNKEMVIYGDVGDNLFPEPITFIQQLEQLNKRVILIIDNCEAKMHNKLTELCQRQNSKISLMTIEYEVKEDDNVDSNNYYLSTTSNKVLEQLIKRDFKEISDSNVDTIVKCSDGNFRIAIYLAKSISTQKNIGILKHNELFERLFYQGNEVDKELLIVGEVCSIFYSFDVSFDTENEKNELNIISNLISTTPIKALVNVEELRKRQIVQRRGNMRAVLPHALSNRLAIDFLEKYPETQLLNMIGKNERLCISFFRRLKFLHSSKKAQNIAKEYFLKLSDEEFINAGSNLLEKIKCITILNPEIVLERIENIKESSFFSRDNNKFYEWIMILGYIAFDEFLFKRAISLMIKFALTEKVDENNNSIRSVLYNFFHLYLSFTHASLKIRISLINELLTSDDKIARDLGIKLIEEILESRHFCGSPMLDCGSQIRDYGVEPNPNEWYEEAIKYCEEMLEKQICYEEIKEVIANNFNNLSSIGFYDLLEKIVENNLNIKSWPSIWDALLSMKHFYSKEIPKKFMSRIDLLLEKVKPLTISDRIKVFLGKGRSTCFVLECISENEEEINNILYTLGKDIAMEKNSFIENMLLLDDTCADYRIGWFAQGLYENFDDKENLIYTILDLVNNDNENIIKKIVATLIGIYHNQEKEMCSKLLDKLVLDEKYNENYVYFQLSYQFEDRDILRLEKAISIGKKIEKNLHNLDWCLAQIETEKIIVLLEKLPINENIQYNIFITLYRLLNERKNDNLLKSYTRKYIADLEYDRMNKINYNHSIYIIKELIKISFSKKDGVVEAKKIYIEINSLIKEKFVTFYSYKNILEPLMRLYSMEFLDIFIDYRGKPSWEKRMFFKRSYNLNENILHYIDDEKIIEWLEKNKKVEELSYMMEPYILDTKEDKYIWSKLGEYIINNYFDNLTIIENITSQVYRDLYSSDYMKLFKKRENLFVILENNTNPIISNIGKKKRLDLLNQMNWWKTHEEKENEERFNTFE